MVLTPGSYYLEVEDNNGCISESDTVTFSDHTSVGLPSDFKMSIYPNPFRDYTTVDFGRVILAGEVKVIDMLGNVLEIYQLEDQRELIIKRNTKSKGVYFVEVTISNKKIFKKITLQ